MPARSATADDHNSDATTNNPSSTDPSDLTNNALDKQPRLSDQQKKLNHISSEQKRRAAIREGFDNLTELVPGLEGQARSESVVLQRSVEYIREKVEERDRLIAEIERRGGSVPHDLRGR